MNDRIKRILYTAWNEPRHFFFWLAFLTLCGLIAALGGAAATHPTVFLSFAALGCALCVVVSIPAFVLAWIPPVRRLFAWLLRRKLLVLGCLVTLVALFYAVEDWRGRSAWQNYKRAAEAKGERFDFASLAPPPVAEDQNLFETPLFNDMHFVVTNNNTIWRTTNWGNHVLFDVWGPNSDKAPATGNWAKAQRADLPGWQAFYRGSNNLFAAEDAAQQAFRRRYGLETASAPLPRPIPPSGPPTNYFPIAKAPQTPAADVLLALSRFDDNRRLLIAAATRPEARFWINYEEGGGMLLPHLARVKSCSHYLALHADAALKAGDNKTALEDVQLLFRLIEAVRGEPLLISHLVRMAMVQIALQPVWSGLADRQWTEADLNTLEQDLSKLDFLADYYVAMRGERACGLWGVDYVRKAGPWALGVISSEDSAAPGSPWPGDWEQTIGTVLFKLVPAGWFDQNKLSIASLHARFYMSLVDRDRRIVSPTAIDQSRKSMKARCRHSGPYDIISVMLLPALGRAAEKFAQAQSSVDLARVACALERYRLANGQFPETLAALAPKFIVSLPHDIINGQPLKYRRTDDGQFILYSVGGNEKDDGGTIGLTKSGNPDWHQGDWVWRYQAK
jgi:hypothetical protein